MEGDALALAMCALSCAVAYFLCGVPTAYLLGRSLGHVDVRTVGSGNIGTTNITRAAGPKLGALTLLGDVAKAALSVGIGYLLVGVVGTGDGVADVVAGQRLDWTLALVFLFCVVGHVFSPYMHFKGGKGIAVGLGGSLALMPLVGVSLLVPFLLFAVLTRYVSLGSIAAAVCLPFLTWLIARPTPAFLAIVVVTAVLVVWAHRSNIVKLVHGRESRFSFKRSSAPENPAPAGETSVGGADGADVPGTAGTCDSEGDASRKGA